MPTVSVPQVNPNDEVTAASVNQGPNAIATVVNGNLDDNNIASLSGTKLASGTVPAAAMTTAANPETRMNETLAPFVASGLVWSIVSGLNGSMTAGVAYVDGKRFSVGVISSNTFTASKDTYVYITNTGAVSYNPQTNGAAQPATPASTVLVAKVVTSGSAITSITALPGKPVGNAILSTAPGDVGGAWANYTPTVTNVTLGNAVTLARYTQIGKTVHVAGRITLGSTSSVTGTISISLPVAPLASTYAVRETVGVGHVIHPGSGQHTTVFIILNSNLTIGMVIPTTLGGSNPVFTETGSSREINNGTPWTWASTDIISWHLTYEAA